MWNAAYWVRLIYPLAAVGVKEHVPLDRGTPAARVESSVKSRSHSNVRGDIASSVTRHLQFPPAWPGTFILLPRPKLRRSCKGAIARAATDDHARRISARATSALSIGLRPK